MSEILEIQERGGTFQVEDLNGHNPDSWKQALLAGLPHVLMGIFMSLVYILDAYEFVTAGKNLADVVGITLVVFLIILLGFVLIIAKRTGWPTWVASWYPYAGLLIILPLLWIVQQVNVSDPIHWMMLVMPPLLALVLYWVARRDRIKEVLIALPVVTILSGALLEFFSPEVNVALDLWGWILTAVAAVMIVRLNNWRLGVWIFMALCILISITSALAYVYLNNIPLEHAPDKNIYEVVRYILPQFFTYSILVLGPQLVCLLRELGKRSGPMGMPGFHLIFWGLLITMICISVANFVSQPSNYIWVYRFRDTAFSICLGGAAVGVLASITGACVLGSATIINKVISSRTTTILIAVVPLGLPWIASVSYNLFGNASWLFQPLSDLLYLPGAILLSAWTLLAAWLVTRKYWED